MPPLRRRMGRPGLVGTAARTAVVAGTATAVVGHSQAKQAAKQEQAAAGAQQQAAAQQAQVDSAVESALAAQAAQQSAAPAPTGLSPDAVAQLQQLAALRDQGILTEEEFAAQKAKLLG